MGENSAIIRLQRGDAACLAACLLLALTACANSYAGIPLKPGAAPADLQDLARRAQAGDKHAQLELGIQYEEGRGVPVNRARAERLYEMAAQASPHEVDVYQSASGNIPAQQITYKTGAHERGLQAAEERLQKIRKENSQ